MAYGHPEPNGGSVPKVGGATVDPDRWAYLKDRAWKASQIWKPVWFGTKPIPAAACAPPAAPTVKTTWCEHCEGLGVRSQMAGPIPPGFFECRKCGHRQKAREDR